MLLDSYYDKKRGYNKVLEEFIVVLWILVQQWVLLYQPIWKWQPAAHWAQVKFEQVYFSGKKKFTIHHRATVARGAVTQAVTVTEDMFNDHVLLVHSSLGVVQ